MACDSCGISEAQIYARGGYSHGYICYGAHTPNNPPNPNDDGEVSMLCDECASHPDSIAIDHALARQADRYAREWAEQHPDDERRTITAGRSPAQEERPMTTQEQVQILATLTTKDEAGRHFMETEDYDALKGLEAAGLITIHRPVHDATGIPYSQEYWSVEVTQDGQGLVDAYPEYWPTYDNDEDAEEQVPWQDLWVVDIHSNIPEGTGRLGGIVERAEAGNEGALSVIADFVWEEGEDGPGAHSYWLVEDFWPDEDPRWDKAHDAPFCPVDWSGLRARVEAALAAQDEADPPIPDIDDDGYCDDCQQLHCNCRAAR